MPNASALEASVLIYAVFHIQEDVSHFHSGELIPDLKKKKKTHTKKTQQKTTHEREKKNLTPWKCLQRK